MFILIHYLKAYGLGKGMLDVSEFNFMKKNHRYKIGFIINLTVASVRSCKIQNTKIACILVDSKLSFKFIYKSIQNSSDGQR